MTTLIPTSVQVVLYLSRLLFSGRQCWPSAYICVKAYYYVKLGTFLQGQGQSIVFIACSLVTLGLILILLPLLSESWLCTVRHLIMWFYLTESHMITGNVIKMKWFAW